MPDLRIGIVALQGAFAEHQAALSKIDVETVQVRLKAHLDGLHGLILPGGESTTISRLLLEYDLFDELAALAMRGFPLFGTCAGMILLGRETPPATVRTLGTMDIQVRRNAFGRQLDSFESDLSIPALGNQPFHAVFIRAPAVEAVGPSVEVLARLPDGTPVATRQGVLLATSFHPELTEDLRLHRYFVDMVTERA